MTGFGHLMYFSRMPTSVLIKKGCSAQNKVTMQSRDTIKYENKSDNSTNNPSNDKVDKKDEADYRQSAKLTRLVKNPVTVPRFFQTLWRLNCLSSLLALTMNNSLILYYIPLLHTLQFILLFVLIMLG